MSKRFYDLDEDLTEEESTRNIRSIGWITNNKTYM